MARRSNKQSTQPAKKAAEPTHIPVKMTPGKRNMERLALRREAKFDRYAVKIQEERVIESRQKRGVMTPVEFRFAVKAGRRTVARATTHRHALKAAHTYCRKQSA